MSALPALPPLPAYPSAPGPERDEWHRLALLHTSAASIAAQTARAEAEQAVADAGQAAAAAQQALVAALDKPTPVHPESKLLREQHTAALQALATAIAEWKPPAGVDLAALVSAAQALKAIREALT